MRLRALAALLVLLLAVRARPGAAQTPPKPDKGAWSAEDLAELDDLEKDVERYLAAGAAHQARIKEMLRREYDRRLADLNTRYDKGIDAADRDFRRRHLDAIKLLKEFLARYPNDPEWTPDAMFRLADLYLDQSKWEFDDKQAEGLADAAAPVEEDFSAPAPYVGPDYSPSVDLWREIVRRFPKYRQVDAVVYALGFYQGEMRKMEESKQAYLGLVCHNKYDPLAVPLPEPTPGRVAVAATPTVFVDPYQGCEPMRKDNADLLEEAWMRIGEAHFDSRQDTREAKIRDLKLAIAAYRHVTVNPASKFYDIALYKLAWACYRSNQFMDGIRAFDELVVFSDKREASGGEKSELRPEAVTYIATSFADPWETDTGAAGAVGDPVKSMERIDAFYRGRESEPHVRDVYEALGDALKLSAAIPANNDPTQIPADTKIAYEQAIRAWRFTLKQFPKNPRNPIVHKKIIDAYAFMGDQDSAVRERREFAELYKEGSEWYTANETNREAIDFASRQGEMALLDAAREAQRQASVARRNFSTTKPPNPALRDSYLKSYADAAALYTRYLAAYPESQEIYAVTYDLAQCFYFGEEYLQAVPHFRWVRDHRDMGTKFREAAKGVFSSYEQEVQKEIAAGTLIAQPDPTPEAIASGQAIPVPQVYRDLQAAYDEYIVLVPDDQPTMKALAAGMISFRYLQLEDALTRFEKLWQTYCATPEAEVAKDSIVVIYQSRGQLDASKDANNRFVEKNCGTSEARTLAEAQNRSIDYNIAVDTYKKAVETKDPALFEKAGLAFYTIYKTSPDKYENRAEVLFNAALCYTAGKKPKTAIAIDQEFLSIPAFRDSPYYIEVLDRTAFNYQNAFDYDRAVEAFTQVAEVAAEPGRKDRVEFDLAKCCPKDSCTAAAPGCGLQQARLDAMWNQALLRDLDRVYYDRGKNDPGAATLYKRYAAAEKQNRKRASLAYFNAALVYEKAGSTKDMIKTFDEWRKLYGTDPDSGPFLVLAQYKTAKALEKARDRKGAEQYYIATINTFDAARLPPGSPSADLAAEAQFWLAEKVFNDKFVPYKVKWLGRITPKNDSKAELAKADKAVADTLDALKKVTLETAEGYKKVARFESAWSLAALVRLGEIQFSAGDKLLEAPAPKEILDLEKSNPEVGALLAYQDGLLPFVQQIQAPAESWWVQAVEAARKKGVSTIWSKRAQEDLNKYVDQAKYPVMRDELVDREVNP